MTAADQGQLTRARSSPEQPLCAEDPLVYFSLAERPAALPSRRSPGHVDDRTAGPDRRDIHGPGGQRGFARFF